MSKYLYGAAVQGIQSFIFQTNKLKEIVGASELVEEICTTKFWEVAGIQKDDQNIILNAAGNIKYIFEDEPKCRGFVKLFPKVVMELAPGITISQAVVKYEEGELNCSLQKLEDKLREQRNKVSIPFETGFMGTERSRRTGGVAYLSIEDEMVDEATSKKLKASEDDSLFAEISSHIDLKDPDKDILTNIDKLFSGENNTWLAVIHADGNGIGAIVQNLNKTFKDKEDELVKKAFKSFSEALDKSTKVAAQNTFDKVVKDKKQDEKPYPIRPIILGGDDLTVIIKADLAFDFTTEFLVEFEKQTKANLNFLKDDFGITDFENGITACAGIAYVKKAYPFHYAVQLAEMLCIDAKNFVKGKGDYEKSEIKQHDLVPKSSVAFFKVQDSFIEVSLKDMKERVLKGENIDFNYGPYLIEENEKLAHVGELQEKLAIIENKSKKKDDKDKSNGVSKLRQWASEVFKDKVTADFILERMSVVNKEFYNEMNLENEKRSEKSIIYDIIQLDSFKD